MLVGLSRPDRGSARLLGQPSRLAASVFARVGVVIDGPAFVPHLSGRRNLPLLWLATGVVVAAYFSRGMRTVPTCEGGGRARDVCRLEHDRRP